MLTQRMELAASLATTSAWVGSPERVSAADPALQFFRMAAAS